VSRSRRRKGSGAWSPPCKVPFPSHVQISLSYPSALGILGHPGRVGETTYMVVVLPKRQHIYMLAGVGSVEEKVRQVRANPLGPPLILYIRMPPTSLLMGGIEAIGCHRRGSVVFTRSAKYGVQHATICDVLIPSLRAALRV
jgi:hypothetical protein